MVCMIPATWIQLGAYRHMQRIHWRFLMTSNACFFIHFFAHTAGRLLHSQSLLILPTARNLFAVCWSVKSAHSVARNLLYWPRHPADRSPHTYNA